MSPFTHLLGGWMVANITPMRRRERAAVTLAAVVPDLDGAGLVVDLFQRGIHTEFAPHYEAYHRMLGHNVFVGIAIAVVCYAVARERRWLVASLGLLSFHTHLLGDLVGSRGPTPSDIWPIYYLWPLSSHPFAWSGQWALNAWPNIALTFILLMGTIYLAWRRGYSLVGIVSPYADEVFVRTLRRRFPHAPDQTSGKDAKDESDTKERFPGGIHPGSRRREGPDQDP